MSGAAELRRRARIRRQPMPPRARKQIPGGWRPTPLASDASRSAQKPLLARGSQSRAGVEMPIDVRNGSAHGESLSRFSRDLGEQRLRLDSAMFAGGGQVLQRDRRQGRRRSAEISHGSTAQPINRANPLWVRSTCAAATSAALLPACCSDTQSPPQSPATAGAPRRRHSGCATRLAPEALRPARSTSKAMTNTRRRLRSRIACPATTAEGQCFGPIDDRDERGLGRTDDGVHAQRTRRVL